MRSMVIRVPELTGYAGIRHVDVSLPYAAQLIDWTKYTEHRDAKPPEDRTEAYRARAPRVSLRRLVLLSLTRDAEQEERKLRSKLAAAAWRQRQAEAELTERLSGIRHY